MKELVAGVSETMADRRIRLALAESCTGGLLAAWLTERPGASRFLEAGLVTYSDEAKQALLGVGAETLATHGAVSEAVAREMLEGARRRTGAEAAVAITGIAGPDGGSDEKPVGTVWIGAALGSRARVRRHHFHGDRGEVREASGRAALELLREILEEAP